MAQINPYLTFNGNCEEAMSFYKECLGGVLVMQKVRGSHMEDQFPAGSKDKILHASLTNDAMILLGSDRVGAGNMVKGNTLSLSLKCANELEIRTFFEKLSSGGQIVHPLHSFFAGTMGTLTDKFERDWLVYLENSKFQIQDSKLGTLNFEF